MKNDFQCVKCNKTWSVIPVVYNRHDQELDVGGNVTKPPYGQPLNHPSGCPDCGSIYFKWTNYKGV